MNEGLVKAGFDLPLTVGLKDKSGNLSSFQNSLVIVPPAASTAAWMKKLEPYSTAMASGWMSIRGSRRRMTTDRGFALSDHADWSSLNKAVQETEASRIIVTHGYKTAFAQWLREKGYEAEASTSDYFSSGEADDH